ncbi:MAG: aminotransferase class IV, partial [Caulobacteraceae bacterium]
PLILALNQAIAVGADEALMLDPAGCVATCNATNFFFVAGGKVQTSSGRFGFAGITRGNVIALCAQNAIDCEQGDFPPEALESADEAFVTGTMGGIAPVARIDGHFFPEPPGPLTRRMGALYADLVDAEAALHKRHR